MGKETLVADKSVRKDIEKALDYAPLVGVALGAAAGNALGIRKANKIYSRGGGTSKALPAFASRVAGGAAAGGLAGKVVSNESSKRRRK